MVESRSYVQREGVYRWFSNLTSAQRAEFLCGLLDLCVPIELRFLGSCLEDLARKDYHSLRDAEIKANNPADLSGLTNVTDEVVRSKLLVSLALLGTDNREAAGVLYRTLTHIDTVINNYGLALNDGRTEEQFLLLFTMASNHPAFNFHQKQVLRQELGHIQDILQASKGGEAAAEPGGDGAAVSNAQPHHQTVSAPQAALPPSASTLPSASTPYLPTCCWHKTPNPQNQTREASTGSGPPSGAALGHEEQAARQELPSPPPTPPQIQDTQTRNRQKAGKAVIERVLLRKVTHKSENGSEYVFEVGWSNSSTSSVVKTQQEVAELISQLSQVFPDDGLEKFLHQSLEIDTRCLTALPAHVLHHHTVQLFFTSNRPVSPNCPSSPSSARLPPPSSLPSSPAAPTCPLTSSSNTDCTVQYRGANRAVYRVASVQPVVSTHSSVLTRSPPHLSSLLPPPPVAPPQHPLPSPSMHPLPLRSPAAGGGDTSSPLHHSQPHSSLQHHLHPQTGVQPSTQSLHLSHSQQGPHSHSLARSQSHPAQIAQSQPNPPEQNGILDWLRKLRLHKYYPVFKQLTMEEFLALTEEDLNKYDLTQGAKKKLKTQLELQKSADREMKMEKRPCGGIARVTPSSHMGISTHPTSPAGELRGEVDGAPHPPSLHHLMSTDSSSSPGFSGSSCSPWMALCCDSAGDRTRDVLGRPNPPGGTEKDRFILNSSCPTGSSRPTAQVLPVQTDPAPPHPPSCSSHLPFGFLQTAYHPQPSYPQSVPNPARILSSPRKPRPSPLCTDDRTKPLGAVAVGAGFGLGHGVGVAARLENQFSGLSVDGSPGHQEPAVGRRRTGGPMGLMVETSSALTSTSNSLHHVSQPPLLFHLSSSPTGYHIYPPTSSSCTSSTSVNPSGAGPGNPYYQPTSSPTPPTTSAPSSDQSPAQSTSACVCSSCGCHGHCSPYGGLPGYAAAGYLQPFSAGPSLFTLGPLLHLSPLIASSSTAGPGAPHFSYPMMVPPPIYRQSPTSHEQQPGFGFYQPHGFMGNGGQKRAAGNMSCYNCGGGGHRAEDCKQPPMDSVQQGTFRLKFTPHSQNKDSVD